MKSGLSCNNPGRWCRSPDNEGAGEVSRKNKYHALSLLENCSLTVVEQKISGPFHHNKDGTENHLSRLEIKNKVLKKNSLL